MAAVVLAALDHRRRTGQGGHLDFSQAEAALHFLSPGHRRAAGHRPTADAAWATTTPAAHPHGVWACAGEEFLAARPVGPTTSGPRLVRLLGEQPLDAWLAARPAAEAQAALVAAGVAAHEVQGRGEGSDDPQLAHLGHWVDVDPSRCTGDLTVEATRFRLSRTPVGPRAAGPMLNQHRDEVLAGFLGYPPERVAELDDAGVLS